MTPPDPVPRSAASKIKNARGERLDYTFVAGRPGQMDVAILAHGVTSQKDRPWALDLEAALTAAGIAVMRFSFPECLTSPKSATSARAPSSASKILPGLMSR